MSGMTFTVGRSRNVQNASPATGTTVVVDAITNALLLTPAALIATLTVSMPASPTNGQEIVISSSQAVTALTMNSGTIVNPLTTLALGGFASFVFNTGNASWFRTG